MGRGGKGDGWGGKFWGTRGRRIANVFGVDLVTG